MTRKKQLQPLSGGDKAFFLRFYEEYKSFLYYMARRYARDQADCDDLVQNVLLRLMQNISTIREIHRCKIATYIVLTIRTTYLDSERRRKNENLVFMDDDTLEMLMAERFTDHPGDADILFAREAVTKLKEMLTPRDWCILEGKYILGLSDRELGGLTGISPDSVRMVLHRARKKARSILEKDMRKGADNDE